MALAGRGARGQLVWAFMETRRAKTSFRYEVIMTVRYDDKRM